MANGDGTLIPGLPNDIAKRILASLPYSHLSRLRSTARSWYNLISSDSIGSVRRHHCLPPRQFLCLFPSDPSVIPPFLFEPVANAWTTLPLLPLSRNRHSLYNFATVALGPHLYVLGGTQYNKRTLRVEWLHPSTSVYRIDLSVSLTPRLLSWTRLPNMRFPRGDFACAPIPHSNSIIVAGGGSRSSPFPYSGFPIQAVEIFNSDLGEWSYEKELSLPRPQAGCIGFVIKKNQQNLNEEQAVDDNEFWVMGGYCVDAFDHHDYCIDALAFNLRSRKWREIENMWEIGERPKLGKVVVLDSVDGDLVGVFMLDSSVIFRYNFASNYWCEEAILSKKVLPEDSCGFVAIDGELWFITKEKLTNTTDSARITLEIWAYNPVEKKWRIFSTNPFYPHSTDFETSVSCAVRL